MEKERRNARYFAAMNTPDGFKSYFDVIFGGISELYIIKGGPGTGKSRLLRRFSEEAVKRGYTTEEFLCSSDPTSLDGVIVNELSVAMLDGTSPHTLEPLIPGAKDNIIDLGRFWDKEKLKAEKERLRSLSERKKKLYASVYTFLSGISAYEKQTLRTVCDCIDEDKMNGALKRLSEKLRAESGKRNAENRENKIRVRSAVSQSGRIVLPTYAGIAKERFSVSDVCGIGGVFISKLIALTDAAGLEAVVSVEPMRPEYADAVYYPASGISVYTGSETDYEEKQINMRRFINDAKLRPYKAGLRAIERGKRRLLSDMYCVFGEIGILHSETERIYGAAMDFKAKEVFTEELLKNIFG